MAQKLGPRGRAHILVAPLQSAASLRAVARTFLRFGSLTKKSSNFQKEVQKKPTTKKRRYSSPNLALKLRNPPNDRHKSKSRNSEKKVRKPIQEKMSTKM